MLYADHRCFTEDVVFIRTDFKYMGRANIHALPAPITLIRIDGNEPVARTILETIIGYHLSFPAFPIQVKSAFRIPQSEIGYYAFLALFAFPIFNKACPNRAAPMPPAI